MQEISGRNKIRVKNSQKKEVSWVSIRDVSACFMYDPKGAFTLSGRDRYRDQKKKKKLLDRIMWRCSYYIETLMPLSTVAILSVSVQISVSVFVSVSVP